MYTHHIILDLDNTLISAIEWKDRGKIPEEAFFHLNYKIMGRDFIIFARPNLEQFLDGIFANKNFKVSIWSAATKSYIAFIVKHFILTKPSRKLEYIFTDYHCTISDSISSKKCQKDLRLLISHFKLPDESLEKLILIDDNFKDNLEHQTPQVRYVHIKRWDVLSDKHYSDDTELSYTLQQLLSFT